jgi:hypothetical protein
MKTLYESKGPNGDAVKVVTKTMDEGYDMAVALTNDPAVIDSLACQPDRIPQKKLMTLHHGGYATWIRNPDCELAAKETQLGFMCAHCHEPVIAYPALARESSPEILQIRQLCGCTMVMMAPETLVWWSTVNCADTWNTLVAEAKKAHEQYGVE